MKEGNSITEGKLNEILAPKKDLQFNLNHEIKKAIEISNSLTNAEKIKQFKTIMLINIKQKEEIRNLKNIIDTKEAYRRFLQSLNIPDYQDLIIQDEETPRRDPVSENMALLNGKPIKVFESNGLSKFKAI